MQKFSLMIRQIALGLLTSVLSYEAATAEPFDYFKPEGAIYDPAITTPDAFIGYGLGDKPVRHDVMVGYLRTLARQSARIETQTIGASHEGRPILSFVISSPENIARIDEIKANHKDRLAGKTANPDDPVVVWLNYGVHGAESAGMDAAIPTLYHLAAATGDEIDTMLKDTVIVLIAIFNPDGHSRRINHVYTFGGDVSVTDSNNEAHNLWIEARTNHYWFDLNRDWLPLTQPESQSWIKVWHDWKPNVSADFHEQGSDSSYYFHPGEPKRKNPLIPARARELLSALGERHADWLDANGELYTTEEGYDNFYIGKGSTYPSINGSIGILFEAAAARGGAIETINGQRTYAQNIRIHFNTSLTTIRGSHELREDLKAYQRSFFTLAERSARSDDRKAFVFTAPNDRTRTNEFIRVLRSHDISVFALAQDLTIGTQDFAKGTSFVVPVTQAQYTMIRGIFDRVTEFEEAIFYDVSGWTLPLAYDLDYATLDAFRFNQNLLGDAIDQMAVAITPPEVGAYGYLFSWSEYYAPRTLWRFFEAGARPRVIMQPKSIDIAGEIINLAPGAIFIPANTRLNDGTLVNQASLHNVARIAAQQDGVQVFALASGDIIAGSGDLGARDSVQTLRKPKALLLFDDGGTRYSAGQFWHLLDHKMKVPVTLRRKSDIGQFDLYDYTHILIPGGGGNPDEKAAKVIQDWVRGGGTLVTTKSASLWAQNTILPQKDGKKVETADANPADGEKADRLNYADKSLRDAEHLIGGAVFESDLDTSHPLGFGFTDRNIATMKATTSPLLGSDDPYAIVAQYAAAPVLSGYASTKRIEELARTPMLLAERMGRGGVIMFADDPSFRATFLGADKLVMNALFFGDLYEPARRP